VNPVEELADVQRRIDDLREQLRPLQEERARLESILAGPRVRPVVVWGGHREDEECQDLDQAFAFHQGAIDSGWPGAERVLVGGADVSYDEWAEANPDKAWW